MSRYSDELRSKLQVSRQQVYKYINRIKAKQPARVGPPGRQWNIAPEIENEMAEATRKTNIPSFDNLANEVMLLQSERKRSVHKKESVRTAQRRRKRQKITKQAATEQSAARKSSVADPRTFLTFYGCIQVCHVCMLIHVCVCIAGISLLHSLFITGCADDVWYADHSIWRPIGRRVCRAPRFHLRERIQSEQRF